MYGKCVVMQIKCTFSVFKQCFNQTQGAKNKLTSSTKRQAILIQNRVPCTNKNLNYCRFNPLKHFDLDKKNVKRGVQVNPTVNAYIVLSMMFQEDFDYILQARFLKLGFKMPNILLKFAFLVLSFTGLYIHFHNFPSFSNLHQVMDRIVLMFVALVAVTTASVSNEQHGRFFLYKVKPRNAEQTQQLLRSNEAYVSYFIHNVSISSRKNCFDHFKTPNFI